MRKLLQAALGAVFVFGATMTIADMPSIDWDLDDAIRQIDGQADDFESAMARVEVSTTASDGSTITSHSGQRLHQRARRYSLRPGTAVSGSCWLMARR